MAEYELTDDQILAVLASLARSCDRMLPDDLLAEPKAVARAAQALLLEVVNREVVGPILRHADERDVLVYDAWVRWRAICKQLGVDAHADWSLSA